MTNQKTQESLRYAWIDPKNLSSLKIKWFSFIGGCILIAYVETESGERFLIRTSNR